MQVYDALQHLVQISFNCLFYLYVCDCTVSSLPHSNSGDSFARAAIKMFWLKFLHRRRSRDLSQSRSHWFQRRLPTSCKSLPRAVGRCEILIYGQLCRGFTWHAKPKQTPPSFDGKQAQWVARTFSVEGIDRYLIHTTFYMKTVLVFFQMTRYVFSIYFL